MIDASTLPYVDLGNSPDALKEYAKTNFGKVISPLAKDDTVKDRFAAIYFEETGVKLAPVDIAPEEPDDEDEKSVTPAVKREPIAYTIVVQDDPLDTGAICGSVNFIAYRIQRNVEVKVSKLIYESLKNAVRTIYDPVTLEPKDIPYYPFSVVQVHYEGDVA